MQYCLGGLDFLQALLLFRDVGTGTAITDKLSFLVEARQPAGLDPDLTIKTVVHAEHKVFEWLVFRQILHVSFDYRAVVFMNRQIASRFAQHLSLIHISEPTRRTPIS